jgi:hypothetical protein
LPTVSNTQAALELWLNAQLPQPAVDFWAATMNQHWSDANRPQQHKVSDHTSLQQQEQ